MVAIEPRSRSRPTQFPKQGGPIMRENPTNPLKAIRLKCLDCCCDSPSEVKECPCVKCALHPFRLGKNPYRIPRVLSEEQRERQIQTFAISRESSNGNRLGRQVDPQTAVLENSQVVSMVDEQCGQSKHQEGIRR